jgi:hypothetical protein
MCRVLSTHVSFWPMSDGFFSGSRHIRSRMLIQFGTRPRLRQTSTAAAADDDLLTERERIYAPPSPASPSCPFSLTPKYLPPLAFSLPAHCNDTRPCAPTALIFTLSARIFCLSQCHPSLVTGKSVETFAQQIQPLKNENVQIGNYSARLDGLLTFS